MSTPKQFAAAVARVGLDAFLRTPGRLDFRPRTPPRVSALMLVAGRAEVTFACLRSLAAGPRDTPLELVIVDNASADDTPALLDRLDGATVVRNPANVGFPAGVNQAAARATGDYLLFVNNDTEVLGRSVDAAADYLDAHPDVAWVGGRVVLMDGTLQEAGVQIKSDGWTHQYARGRPADDPSVMFERDVDYCSFVFATVRRAVFEAVGGLDEAFSPGYFEDPDFAVRVRSAGWRVVYLPDVVVLHHENATSAGTLDVPALAARNHKLFAARHAGWLARQLPLDPPWTELGRRADDPGPHVLLLTDGPDAARLARALEALGAGVTVGVTGGRGTSPPDPLSATERGGRATPTPDGLPVTAEVVPLPAPADLDRLLAARRFVFDLAVLAAPHPPDWPAALRRHGVPTAERTGERFRLLGP